MNTKPTHSPTPTLPMHEHYCRPCENCKKLMNAHEVLVKVIKDVLSTVRPCIDCEGAGGHRTSSDVEPPEYDACGTCGGTGKNMWAEGEIGNLEAALKLAGEE